MRLRIRPAKQNDFNEIKHIAFKGWMFAYNYLQDKLILSLVEKYYSQKNLDKAFYNSQKGIELFLVVDYKQKIIGFCRFTFKDKMGELNHLYIDTRCIGKGVGKRLLTEGEEFLIKKGCKKYHLYVYGKNEQAIKFYLKNGFKRIKENDKEDKHVEGEFLVYMEKSLDFLPDLL